ncbi:MAG TPA: phosphoribosyltransferase family protein [bacterium]|jgi:predicted amidophosphoribosyltransferase|nr:phosphoribosyltransferase family protein [bacterium]
MGPAGLIDGARRAAGLLFSRPCLACGGPVPDPALGAACEGCWARLEAEPLPRLRFTRLGRPDFDQAVAAFAYGGTLRELVLAYKFSGHPSLRRPLAAALARRCEAALGWGCGAVAALPWSRASLGERGYDAAGELARDVAAAWGLPVLDALAWARPRRRQSELGANERLANASLSLRARPGAGLAGGRILIIDDLLSSGATAHEAARALKAGGATFVGVAALAHALA